MDKHVKNQPSDAVLFQLGQVVATPDALDHLKEYNCSFITLIRRHVNGDWGDLCKDDCLMNKQAIIHEDRILSAYIVGGEKVYVLTEADRKCTTLLLASEY